MVSEQRRRLYTTFAGSFSPGIFARSIKTTQRVASAPVLKIDGKDFIISRRLVLAATDPGKNYSCRIHFTKGRDIKFNISQISCHIYHSASFLFFCFCNLIHRKPQGSLNFLRTHWVGTRAGSESHSDCRVLRQGIPICC